MFLTDSKSLTSFIWERDGNHSYAFSVHQETWAKYVLKYYHKQKQNPQKLLENFGQLPNTRGCCWNTSASSFVTSRQSMPIQCIDIKNTFKTTTIYGFTRDNVQWRLQESPTKRNLCQHYLNNLTQKKQQNAYGIFFYLL